MNDVEQLLIGWLNIPFPDAYLCTEVPEKVLDVVPVVRVRRTGGPREYALDIATVVVEVFHGDRPSAKAYAAKVEHALYWDLPAAGVGVSQVRTLSGPSWAPWDNTNVRRILATYQIRFRNI